MAENKNKGNSKQPPNPEIGIFESVEKRFSPENKDTMDKKTLLVNKSSTSGIKRSKSPPLSSSLRQNKLSEESFSPKKKPTTMSGCGRKEQALHYDTPLYCSVQFRKSLLNPDSKIKDFTENQMNSLQFCTCIPISRSALRVLEAPASSSRSSSSKPDHLPRSCFLSR